MARIRINCPKCSTGYDIDEMNLGKKGKCKTCETTFVLSALVTPDMSGKDIEKPAALLTGGPNFAFYCPECRTKSYADLKHAGSVVPCPACAKRIAVPTPCEHDDLLYCSICVQMEHPVCPKCGKKASHYWGGSRCDTCDSDIELYVSICPKCKSQRCRMPRLRAARESVDAYRRIRNACVSDRRTARRIRNACVSDRRTAPVGSLTDRVYRRICNALLIHGPKRMQEERAIEHLRSLSVLPKTVTSDSGLCVSRSVVLPLEEMHSVQCASFFASRILEAINHEPDVLCLETMESWQKDANYRTSAIRLIRVAHDCFQAYFSWEGHDGRITGYGFDGSGDSYSLTNEGTRKQWDAVGPW